MTRRDPLRLLASLLLALAGDGLAAHAHAVSEDPFQPVPLTEQAAYHFNYAKVFFPTDQAEADAVRSLDAQAKRLRSLKGHILASPQNLYAALKGSDDFDVSFERVYAYLKLKYSVNTKAIMYRDQSMALEARLSPQIAFVNDEVKAITPAQTAKYLAAYPPLRPYRYVIEETVRARPHTLSLREEQILSATGPLLTEWQSDQYDLLMDRAPWGQGPRPAGRRPGCAPGQRPHR